jgi:hypothetical protein
MERGDVSKLACLPDDKILLGFAPFDSIVIISVAKLIIHLNHTGQLETKI